MSEVEVIVKAAARLRQLAAHATRGPWRVDGPYWHGCVHCQADGPAPSGLVTAGLGRVSVLLAPAWDTDLRAAGNLALAATFDPLAAAAVAGLLETVAGSHQLPHPVAVRALEVAWAVLGDRQEVPDG